jgi:hypothetical protein
VRCSALAKASCLVALFATVQAPATADDTAKPNTLTAEEVQQGFVLLFNGRNLEGWKAQAGDQFRVEAGRIISDGTKGRSMLYYVGRDGKASFSDFELRLQVFTHKGGNSGIYFRTRWQPGGFPDAYGYEAQIANTHRNPRKTGSLYTIADVKESPVKDDEWFDYHVVANGRGIAVKVNGTVVSEFEEPADPAKRKPLGDLIALQGHDPAAVEFRSIRIRPISK